MIGYEDNKGTNVQDSRVWFVRDGGSYQRVEFYLVSGKKNETYGKIKIEAKLGGVTLGTIERTLQPRPVFADAIDLVTGWAEGRDFDFGISGGGIAARGPTFTMDETWATPLLIPFMVVGHNVEGITLVARGMGNGIIAGFKDDYEFIKLIIDLSVDAGNWVYQKALEEITRWQNDPYGRMAELQAALSNFFAENVFNPLADEFNTLEGFKRRFWQVVGTQQALSMNLWEGVVTSLTEWVDDFDQRMMDEKDHATWLQTPWDTSPLMAQGTALYRQYSYEVGYIFGYISEQAAVGALSAGTIKIAQVAVKGGIKLSGKLAFRTVGAVAARTIWIKKILADSSLTDALIRAAYERGMVMCAVEPVGPTISKTAFEILETLFTRSGFNRATYNFQSLMRDAIEGGNIRKLVAKQGGEAMLQRRAAQLAHLLGDECDATIMKNFVKVAEERLIIGQANGSVDEFFEAFFRSMEGNPALLKHADDSEFVISNLNPNAKARLKQILSDPDPGNPWKLDDPPSWPPTGEPPPIPSNYWARGMLLEVDAYKRIYKPLGYAHNPTAVGVDFTGLKSVQLKTLKNPDGAIQAMKSAIDDLLEAAPSGPVKLHILKKPGATSSSLEAALAAYKNDLPQVARDRLEILIQAYNLGP